MRHGCGVCFVVALTGVDLAFGNDLGNALHRVGDCASWCRDEFRFVFVCTYVRSSQVECDLRWRRVGAAQLASTASSCGVLQCVPAYIG
jgi:hypothetical protein